MICAGTEAKAKSTLKMHHLCNRLSFMHGLCTVYAKTLLLVISDQDSGNNTIKRNTAMGFVKCDDCKKTRVIYTAPSRMVPPNNDKRVRADHGGGDIMSCARSLPKP